MKYLFLILLSVNFVYSQESKYYLKKRDTLYIFIDENIRLDFSAKRHKDIFLNNKKVGVETIYNLFSDSIKIHRDIQIKEEIDNFNNNQIVSRPYNSSDLGIDFYKITSNLDYITKINEIRSKSFSILKKRHSKLNMTKIDSVNYDMDTYSFSSYRNETNIFSSITLSSFELKKLNVFVFDKTQENYNRLIKMVSEIPYIIFFCSEKLGKGYKDGPDWFIFDEVVYREKNLNGRI